MNVEQINLRIGDIAAITKVDKDTKLEVQPYAKAAELAVASVDIDKERGFTSVILVNQAGTTVVGYAKRHLAEDPHSTNTGVNRALIDGIKRYCKIKRRHN